MKVASGLPERNGDRHVLEMARLSFQLRRELHFVAVPYDVPSDLKIRVGMHSGKTDRLRSDIE